jgi:hypothetical protein
MSAVDNNGLIGLIRFIEVIRIGGIIWIGGNFGLMICFQGALTD